MENAFSIKTSPAKIRIALRYSEFEVSKVDSAKFVAPSGVPVKAKATDLNIALPPIDSPSLAVPVGEREREQERLFLPSPEIAGTIDHPPQSLFTSSSIRSGRE